MTLDESMSLSIRRSRNDTFAAFDECLLHLGRPVVAVEFIVEAAGIADCMPRRVAAPEGSGGGVAVLTGYEEVA
jgi:hypothetical protein